MIVVSGPSLISQLSSRDLKVSVFPQTEGTMGLMSPICFPSDWTNLEEQQNSTMQGEAKGESPP